MKLKVPIQIYSDLGVIDPSEVRTEEDEENYYKSLQYCCKDCDCEGYINQILAHFCSENGKSKYNEYQQQALNRKIERLKNND